MFRIGNSEPAPKFEIKEQPNNWVKEMKKPSGSVERTVLPKIKDMLEWGVVKAGDILVAKGSDEEATLLQNGHVSINDEEMSMQDWLRRVTGWKSVETYKFAIHKEKYTIFSFIHHIIYRHIVESHNLLKERTQVTQKTWIKYPKGL